MRRVGRVGHVSNERGSERQVQSGYLLIRPGPDRWRGFGSSPTVLVLTLSLLAFAMSQ